MADIKSHSTLPTSLNAYWDLEEASGTRYDLVNSLNWTDNNTVTQGTGIIGKCATFVNANSEYFSQADNASLRVDDGWSVAGWAKLDASTDSSVDFGYRYIFYSRTGENGWGLTLVHSASNQYVVRPETGSGAYGGTNGTTLMDRDTWYHIAVYYNGASSKIWVNGSSESVSLSAITNPSTTVNMGGKGDSIHFDGLLEEWGIWNKELSDSEVSALYNSGSGLPYYDPADIANDTTLTTSLVSYWELEEDSGETRVDSHGSNDLTDSTTVARATGVFGGSDYGADFESGNSEYLLKTSSSGLATGEGARSISMWIKIESLTTAIVPLAYGTRANYQNWTLYIGTDGKLLVDVFNESASASTTAMSTGTWYHVVVTYDGTTLKYYFNGSQDATTDNFTNTLSTGSGTNLYIGVNNNGTQFYFDGVIDEVGFWSKAITQAEVRALYGYGTPPVYSAGGGGGGPASATFISLLGAG